jgi:putative membrane protein
MADTSSPSDTDGTKILRGALAGLLAGVVASFAMDRFQALAASFSASDSDEEPATAKAADRVKQSVDGAPVPEPLQPLAGQIVHYAVGAGLGLAYGIAAEFRPGLASGYGAPFGVGVAAVLDESAVPAAGLGAAPWDSPASTHAFALASHLVFGVVADLVRRQVRSTLLPST